jgi:replication factor C subunit 2/4
MTDILKNNIPWIEKYRPSILDNIVGNDDAISRLNIIANDGNMPHLLLSGPSGTGKTTSIYCLSKKLLGTKLVQDGVLELNASDERGIDIVRGKIKMFAQQKLILPNGRNKIIILDEADSMTSAAMQAMRRTMELYSSTTSFVLICNNSSKIIEPIQSRCSMIRYTRLEDNDIIKQIRMIATKENISITDDGCHAIIFTSNGDMRQAINILQSCAAGFDIINEKNVYYIADIPHPTMIKDMINKCINKDIDNAFTDIKNIYNMGYSPADILGTIYNVSKSLDISDEIKLPILKEIGFSQLRVSEGLSTLCQLVSLIGYLCKIKPK